MAVTDAAGNDAGEHIEVALSSVVPQPLHMSLGYQERILVVQIRCQAWVDVPSSEFDNRVVCGTLHRNGGVGLVWNCIAALKRGRDNLLICEVCINKNFLLEAT